ncbi:MAG: hydroxymethylbilane synthase [Acidimicrobiaceae bacterium]|nr:hydroxymethylbilane synthase [Acidimicrobiaceae bacterium]|tara:strand:+ start:416 stop:1321 length:906 start_codon:yes stop_codon:yes gene_type:complete
MSEIIRIATRNSPLALRQANIVKDILKDSVKSKLIPMTSSGDSATSKEFKKLGGKGLFLKELEESLLSGDTDIAVHSLKDVPFILNSKFEITTISTREVPMDAFISNKFRSIYDLPKNAVIATSSPRRIAVLKSISRDFKIVEIRGNIQTRLKKLKEENYDGIILAAAGLHRMSIQKEITEYLPIKQSVPSAGQGILCIEYLKKNMNIKRMLKKYKNQDVDRCAAEERSFIGMLDGDCLSPIGAHAMIQKEQISLTGFVASKDGNNFIKTTCEASIREGIGVGKKLGNIFIKQGAKKLLRK